MTKQTFLFEIKNDSTDKDYDSLNFLNKIDLVGNILSLYPSTKDAQGNNVPKISTKTFRKKNLSYLIIEVEDLVIPASTITNIRNAVKALPEVISEI